MGQHGNARFEDSPRTICIGILNFKGARYIVIDIVIAILAIIAIVSSSFHYRDNA